MLKPAPARGTITHSGWFAQQSGISSTCGERSAVGFPGATQLPAQPSSGEIPIPDHCVRRNSQHFGRFFYAQTTKEAHFEDSALAFVGLCKALQREIQAHNLFHLVRREDYCSLYRNVKRTASTLLAAPQPRVVDENVPHHLGGDGEKVRAIPPSGVHSRNQSKKRFLHQGGRLHRVIFAFTREVTARKPMQFRTD